jgi:hypothetical protein
MTLCHRLRTIVSVLAFIALGHCAIAADAVQPVTPEPGKPAVVTTPNTVTPAAKPGPGTAAVASNTAQDKPSGPNASDSAAYTESAKVILELFVVALLIESALALIFRWKPFLTVFDPKAVNSVIALAVSLAFVWVYNFDAVAKLLKTYGYDPTPSHDAAGYILTAMIVAGGSKGVNRIFQALGFRSPLSQDEPSAQRPPPNKAWIAVTPVRVNAKGTIRVVVISADTVVAVEDIHARGSKRPWWSFLVRDTTRFPQSGGYPVTPGAVVKVELQGKDAEGQLLEPTRWNSPSPVAAGAIIDLALEI